MAADFRHFSINADDVERALAFYEAVFGWDFQPWGPPDFYLIGGLGVGGGLQGRREIVPGQRMRGVEATMAVDDVAATAAAVERGGGKVVSGPFHIETVGTLIYFEDPEGNIVGAMRYDPREPTPPPGPDAVSVVRHFSINADDVPRAKAFYESVFGWTYESWGGFAEFYIVRNAGRTFNGALQGRRELKPGARMIGFELSISVGDIQALVGAVESAGGQMVMRPVPIPTVGTVAYFEDTEGNLLGAAQYEAGTTFD